MTIIRKQINEVETTDETDTSVSGAWGSARSVGNYGIFAVGINENLGIRTIATPPAGWVELIPKYNPGGNHQSIVVYGRELDGTAADLPTLAMVGPGHMGGFLVEYSNVDEVTAPDEIVNNGSAATSTAWSTGTTGVSSQADGIAIAFFASKNDAQVVSAPTNGFAIAAQQVTDQGAANIANDRLHSALVEKVLTVVASQECTVTSSLARRYSAGMLILNEGAPPPGADDAIYVWDGSSWVQ